MKTNETMPENKRQLKKQINIKWNSRLFFQLGLIVSLLIVFFVMESTIGMTVVSAKAKASDGLEEPPMITYSIEMETPVVEPVKPEIKQPVKRQIVTTTNVVATSNQDPITEDLVPSVDVPMVQDVPVAAPAVPVAPAPSKTENITNVEFVPVYPGCEALGSNKEKIDCMSSKINTFITRNFRTSLLENLDKNEKKRIYVQFKIDAKGYVTDVKANSNNDQLKNEAQRVISKLPTMKPGKQGDKNVDVLYTVPIVFDIH
ncbi:energy transducer TonB [Aequorivita echinoideorum]|uniref:Energy transducer TonB n=1 Tax=Aequorivita echinoideorum TaxID=1549647 RepID=A0ABS5S3C1_9FLAO|nr:energy transducer TonB [Aequorivita echinoideorum]MBT0607711.1 energy transducer TonB [Aequorivita echinoideorum]